jgi:hypothetical protein
VVIAENIERIYRENCQNLGVLTSTNFELVERIRGGETIPLTEFTDGADEITRGIIEHGGLFNYNVARLQGKVNTPPISCHHGMPGDAPASTDADDVRAMRGSGEGNLPGPGPDTGVDYAAAQFVATSTSNVESDKLTAPEGHAHGRRARPMTIAEKIFARHWVKDLARGEIGVDWVQPGDSGFVQTDIRFSHEYVTPMSAIFFEQLVGPDERVLEPESILFFRDHLTFLKDAMSPERVQLGLLDVANQLEVKQREFAEKQGVRLYGELGHGKHGSEAICHSKILEAYALPGHVIIGSDSHTPHAGAVGCVAFGVGTTAIFNSWITRDVRVEVPKSFRVVVTGEKPENVTAKDFMLEILRHPYIKDGHAIGQIIEYAGPAVESLSVDERATMTNMAAEVGAFTGLVAPDAKTGGVPGAAARDGPRRGRGALRGALLGRGRGVREDDRDRRVAAPAHDRASRRPGERDVRGGDGGDGADRHRVRGELHRREEGGHGHVRPRPPRGARARRAQAGARAALHPVRLAGGVRVLPGAGVRPRLRGGGGHLHRAVVRRLHQRGPGRQPQADGRDGERHQPQLPRTLGAGAALSRLALHRGGVGDGRVHHGVRAAGRARRSVAAGTALAMRPSALRCRGPLSLGTHHDPLVRDPESRYLRVIFGTALSPSQPDES